MTELSELRLCAVMPAPPEAVHAALTDAAGSMAKVSVRVIRAVCSASSRSNSGRFSVWSGQAG